MNTKLFFGNYILPAIAASFMACAPPYHMTADPKVYIDTDFMPMEQQGFINALENWDELLDTHLAGNITFMSHNDITSLGNKEGIIMIANHGILEPEECEGNAGVPEGYAAWTYANDINKAVICFNIVDNDRQKNIDYGVDYFTFLAGHELGHALGLTHVDDPAEIMHPQAYGPVKPSCIDAGRAAYINGWRVAPACR